MIRTEEDHGHKNCETSKPSADEVHRQDNKYERKEKSNV